MKDLEDYVKSSVSFLKENLPKDEEIFVGFSGGKDSVVTAELMRMAGVPHKLVYSNTTIDPPEILQLIKKHYPETVWVRPKQSFWKMIPSRNPPLLYTRWCCTALKKRPSWKLPHKHRVFGIRSEESKARFRYKPIDLFKYKWQKVEYMQYHPILDWPEWAVWEFIEGNNLPICPLYDEGFDRLGCTVCCMRLKKGTTKYIAPWKKRFPGYFKAFESACKKWYYKRKAQGRDMYHDSPEEFIQAWYMGKATLYGKKKEKPKMSKKNKDRGKRHERTVAKLMGGKRIGILGKEDISHPKFSIECKSREDIPKWFKDFWEQTLENCEEDKVPMLVIHETQKRYKDDWVVIRMEDFLEVLDGND